MGTSRRGLEASRGLVEELGEARLEELLDRFQEDVSMTVAVRSRSGESLKDGRHRIDLGNYRRYLPDDDALEQAATAALAAGLRILRRGRAGLTVAGPAELVADLVGENLVVYSRLTAAVARSVQSFAGTAVDSERSDPFVAPAHSITCRSSLSPDIDHLAFTPPPLYAAPQPVPPAVAYHNLTSSDLRRLLRVPDSASARGVSVGLIDSGFFPHPYFDALDFRAVGDADDAYGHGTAIAHNVFALAPDVAVHGFKTTDPPQDALEEAADAGVDVISCSWGWAREQTHTTLQLTILDLVHGEGIPILFAAGNGECMWPASEPSAISVGGVHADEADALSASNYASGFLSSRFQGRRVPDVCGLCGQRPQGVYILMPTQPESIMDVAFSGSSHPYEDGTGLDDGWVGASGTSSATAQISAVVALLLARARDRGVHLSPIEIRGLLERSCRPVTEGANALGVPATGHPSVAVGWGIVDVEKALALVREEPTVEPLRR